MLIFACDDWRYGINPTGLIYRWKVGNSFRTKWEVVPYIGY